MAEHIVVAIIVLVLSITATACRRIASYSDSCMFVMSAIFLFNLFAKLLILFDCVSKYYDYLNMPLYGLSSY